MTPERRKYLEHISERERTIRHEIELCNLKIWEGKLQLSRTKSTVVKKVGKKRIKYHKFVVCALKRELERIQPTTDIEFIAQRGCIYAYECCNCHNQFAVRDDDDMLKYCPCCHRRIERNC